MGNNIIDPNAENKYITDEHGAYAGSTPIAPIDSARQQQHLMGKTKEDEEAEQNDPLELESGNKTMSWEHFHAFANSQEHRGLDNVVSCSKVPDVLKCSDYEPEKNSEVNSITLDGTALHYALEIGWLPENAPADIQFKFNYCRGQITNLMNKGWEVFAAEIYYQMDQLTGTIDLVMRKEKDWLIVDFKTGLIHVESTYPQLAANAYLLRHKEEVEGDVYGLIVQPNNPTGMVLIDNSTIINTVKDSVNRISGLEAGNHCNYCDKKYKCKAFREKIGEVESSVLAAKNLDEEFNEAEAGKLFDTIKMYLKFAEDVKKKLNGMANDFGYIPDGYKLYKGRVGYSLNNDLDARKVAENLDKIGVNDDEVWGLIKWDIPGLRKRVPADLHGQFVKKSTGTPYLSALKK